MHHLLQQTHVAQQSRREKLRIPGHSVSLPIQVREFPPDAERAHHIDSEGPLLGIVGGYSETSNQNTTNAMLPLYSSHTISSDPYGLATGVELFAVPAKTDSTFCASPLGIGPQTPVTSGTIYSGQSLVTGGYYNKKNWLSNCGNWDTMNCDSQIRSGGLQGVPAHTSSGASQHCLEATLLLGSLQSCAHKTSSKGGSIASCSLLDTKASPEAMQVYLMNHGASGYTGVPTTGNTVFVGPSNSVPLNPLPSGHHVQQNELENTFPTSQSSSYKSHRSIGGGSLPCYEIPSPQAAHLYDSLRSGDELLLLPSSHASSQAVRHLTDQGLTFQKLSQESFIEAGCRTRKDSFSTFPNQQEQLLQAESDDKCHGEIPLPGSASAHCLNLSLSSKRPLPMQIIGFDVQSEGENFLASQVDAKTLRQISIACTSDMNNLQLPVYGDYTQKMQDIANIYHGRQFQLEHNSPISPELLTFPSRNKYLKAARQLLDEVCSLKRDIVKHNAPKCQNTHIWTGQKLENMDFGSADAVLQGTSGKNQTIFAECIGTRLGPVLPVITENVRALNTEDRKECETKKEKLLLMLQELDRQYRIYTEQMNTVVASFDGVLGVGAAIPYTALALQAMSRYFRCLRDAISGQILLVCRSLGEEDIARQITNRAGISRLRYVHSQIGQQRSFQQLGMLQPHAWRPQRGLPERSVSVLRAWLFEHFLHPYPKDADKMMLARQTGLTRSQVSNWFINARVRLWKPMVEEMYQEESREQEIGTSDRTCKNESRQDLNYTNMAAFDNKITSEGASDLQMLFEGDGLTSEFNAGNMLSTRHESIKAGLGYEAQLFGDTVVDGLSQVQIKKSRLEISSHSNLQSQSKSSEATTKFEDTDNDGMCGAENKTYQRQDSQLYNIPYSESVQQDGECLMPYGDSSLNRAFSSLYPVNGVSLTLGLRHCDNLSLSAARKAYLRTGGQSIAISRRQTVDTEDNDYCNNIYKGSGGQMINHQSTDYPSSKHIEVQILHDFVA